MLACLHLHPFCLRHACILSDSLSKTVNRRVEEPLGRYLDACTGEPNSYNFWTLQSQGSAIRFPFQWHLHQCSA